MKSKIKKIISILLIFISTLLLTIALYIRNVFGNAQFEQLMYSLRYSEGTSSEVFIDACKYCLPKCLILSIILILPFIIKYKTNIYLKLELKKKNKSKKILLYPFKHYLLYSFIIFIALITYCLSSIGTFDYLIKSNQSSSFIEDNYVDPNTVKLDFPQDKQNLIFIFMESMESSYAYTYIDGKEENIIPNLTSIANDNINFSNTDTLGGALETSGATWTIGGIVGQSAGIPLKLIIEGSTYDNTYSAFLPGVTTLGDILEKEGYNQSFLIGSDAAFAGRDAYFTQHGSYQLLDYYWAKNTGKIDEDYFVFWGYEDAKLFDYAKEELLELAESSEPFNLTMLTVDTHAIDGYMDEECEDIYSYTYANAIYCSDSKVGEFISWIKKQDFYENTTIVIVGDHLSMQSDVEDYTTTKRVVYNAFINSQVEATNTTNRTFTAFDIFPSTLASLGVKIEGDRLGLGTNLFSSTNTLAEDLGIDYLNGEISKNSKYYNEHFLESAYLEMLRNS